MPSDGNGGEFTEFQLEEIALGRAQTARRRLDEGGDSFARDRFAEVHAEVERFQRALSRAGDNHDIETPDEEILARYLDGSLSGAAVEIVERALACSADARRQLILLFREVNACVADEPLLRMRNAENDVVAFADSEPSAEAFPVRPWWQVGAGIVGSVLCWGIAIFGDANWRTPFAFAAVAVVALAVTSEAGSRAVQSQSTFSRVVLEVFAIFLALSGVTLAVVNPERLPAACSIVAAAIVALFAIAAHARPQSILKQYVVDQQSASDPGAEVDSGRRGYGGR